MSCLYCSGAKVWSTTITHNNGFIGLIDLSFTSMIDSLISESSSKCWRLIFKFCNFLSKLFFILKTRLDLILTWAKLSKAGRLNETVGRSVNVEGVVEGGAGVVILSHSYKEYPLQENERGSVLDGLQSNIVISLAFV